MGSCVSLRKCNEDLIIIDYYNKFLQEHCLKGDVYHVNYWEFIIRFALFLEQNANEELHRLVQIKSNHSSPTGDDWHCMTSNFIDTFCNLEPVNSYKLERRGSDNLHPYILGIKLKNGY